MRDGGNADITVLSAHLVNKIAAGEVIERPASVVKELVENALDAAAGRIDVAVEKGGRQLVAVTDDGTGMSAENLARAFLPHATSKLADEDDLLRITTMGFRGEALASIAAISHAHVRTRRRQDDAGHELEAAGERIGQVRPCPATPGTTVTVRDLFFSTPARRKFLKSDSTELGHVSEAIARTALPNRQTAFTLSHNGRLVLDLPATDSLARRSADLFGAELAEAMIPIRRQDAEVRVSGLIAPPTATRSTPRWQYFFLNGRFIRDRFLGHALKEAYRGLIDPQRHPTALVFIEMDGEAFDVNVHPTKIEVRFRDSQTVHSHVLASLRETLRRAELRPAARVPTETSGEPAGEPPDAPAGQDQPDDPRRESLRQALADFFKGQAEQARLHFPEPRDRPSRLAEPRRYAPTDLASGPPQTPDQPGEPERLAPSTPPPGTPGDARTPATPAVLQVNGTYLVLAEQDGITIVDQHALHERILYNQLVRRLAVGPLEGQGLLMPATLTVSLAQRALLAEHAALLGRLGIEVGDFGPDSVAVQRFPSFLDRVAPAAFLADLLDELAEDDPALGGERLVHRLLDTMACQAAVKAGDELAPQEIQSLLAQREQAEKSTACPHGRPTQIRLSLRDLEKQFKRG